MKKVQRDPDGVKLNNPDRTCSECALYPCILGQDNCVCDFAKYGCYDYKSSES